MPPRFSILPVQLSAAVSWTGLQGPRSSPVFPVSGSLDAAPPFPRLGPGESGSPTSRALWRRYDPHSPHHRSLIWFASGAHAIPPRFVSLLPALPGGWRSRIEPGSLVSRRSKLPACSHVGVSGTSQVSRRPVLCLCPGLGSRPNRQHLAIDGAVDVAPAIPDTKASADFHIETTAGLQHLLPTLQE